MRPVTNVDDQQRQQLPSQLGRIISSVGREELGAVRRCATLSCVGVGADADGYSGWSMLVASMLS